MHYLVIGGAGYIGSHFVLEALRQGHSCVVYDNLSRGSRAAVPRGVRLIEADLHDERRLTEVLKAESFDSVLHFAAFALVAESVAQPDIYYHNNGEGVRILLNALRAHAKTTSLVFSSTCAIFGIPQKLPIAEDDPKNPISPYGRSKLLAEWLIEDFCGAYGVRAMCLRYFNASGADKITAAGEDHQPETHLLPNVILAALAGKQVTIFGKDFDTADGTCVRDYIHVTDLADAHIRATQSLKLARDGYFDTVNLGTGHGYSNLEVLSEVAKTTNLKIDYKFGERRPGDPPALYTDNSKAKKVLGFVTQHSDLANIVATAVNWHRSHPRGYR